MYTNVSVSREAKRSRNLAEHCRSDIPGKRELRMDIQSRPRTEQFSSINLYAISISREICLGAMETDTSYGMIP